MKKTLLITALLAATTAFSQIKVSEYDPTIKSYSILTEKKIIAKGTHGCIGSEDNLIVLVISGTTESATVIRPGDQAIFLLDNDSTVTLTSPKYQEAKYFAEGILTFDFAYTVDTNQLKMLTTRHYTKITLFAIDDMIELKSKNNDNLAELIKAFMAEYDKHKAQFKTK